MRMEIIQRKLQACRAELAVLQAEEEFREQAWSERIAELRTRRSREGDTATAESGDSQEGKD